MYFYVIDLDCKDPTDADCVPFKDAKRTDDFPHPCKQFSKIKITANQTNLSYIFSKSYLAFV